MSQTEKLRQLLSDGKPHRTDEIQIAVYGANHLGTARIASRITDLKQKHGCEITGYKDPEKPSLYWYQMKVEKPEVKVEEIKMTPMFEIEPDKPSFSYE